jgi:hypothetical protein
MLIVVNKQTNKQSSKQRSKQISKQTSKQTYIGGCVTEEGAAMKPRGMPSSRNDSVDDGLEDDT